MNRFVVRITLHSASETDYENLHEAMKANGFSRFILASDGLLYRMPYAQYYREDQSNLNQVFDDAKYAAASTGRAFSVFGSHTIQSIWFGLPAV